MKRRVVALLFFLVLFTRSFAVVNDNLIHVHYTWICEKQEQECSLDIDRQLFEHYRHDREHITYRYQSAFENEDEEPVNYFGFMFSEYDREVIRALVSQLVDPGMSDYDKTQRALVFVQSLQYVLDTVSMGCGEYVRYPVETLVDGEGDCEDKTMLLGAILHELGMDFIVLVMPDHMALGVHCDQVEQGDCLNYQGKKYYFMETTGKNWKIGQIPDLFRDLEMEVFLPSDTPVFVFRGLNIHSERVSSREKATFTLQLNLLNAGPGQITGLQVRLQTVDNETRKGDAAMEETFLLDDLMEGEERIQNLQFKRLVKKNSVLKLVFSGDQITDKELEVHLNYSSGG